jgi:hypothetical protein
MNQNEKQTIKKALPNDKVLKEEIVSVKTASGIGIMKHKDGRIEKRKF